MTDTNKIGDAKLAAKVIEAYADIDRLAADECKGLGIDPAHCDVLRDVLGDGRDGVVTGDERKKLESSGFSDGFIKGLAGDYGVRTIVERARRLSEQSVKRWWLPDGIFAGSVERRIRAAEEIGKIGPAAIGAVANLAKALDDPEERVRRAAAGALGAIGPAAASAVPALVDALDRYNPEAIDVLVKMGAAAIPALNGYLSACPDKVKKRINLMFRLIGRELSKSGAVGEPVAPFVVTTRNGKAIIEGVRFRPENVDFNIKTGEEETLASAWKAEDEKGAMINGGYFDAEGKPLGLLVKDGQVLTRSRSTPPYSGLLSISREGDWELKYLKDDSGEIRLPADASQYRFALQAGPMIIEPGGKDGIPKPDPMKALLKRGDPGTERTAIARSKGGEWFFITSEPMGLYDFQTALRDFIPDIDAALNLDGGPSTGLAAEGMGVMMEPGWPLPVILHVKPRKK